MKGAEGRRFGKKILLFNFYKLLQTSSDNLEKVSLYSVSPDQLFIVCTNSTSLASLG